MPTIMIVDDQIERVNHLKSLLDENYTVITMSNSKEAIEHLDASNENPVDLLLVNTQIPGTTNRSFLSLKPTATMKSMENDSFIPVPLSKDSLHEFIQKEIKEE